MTFTFATMAEAHDYVDQAIEIESEQRAEYGSGCVSLGYDASDWAVAYEGYRTSDDPDFADALRLINIIAVIIVPSAADKAARLRAYDDIPF